MASDTKKARYDVSRQVKDAIERDDWAEVARILSECSRRDSDSVMTQLVSRDQWDAVKQVIRCVGDEERTWNIEGVLVKNNILLSVAEGNWRGIGEMPHERFLHSTLEWILQQACTRAKQTDIVQYVLPHCEDDQLDSALQQLVTHGLWFAAGRMLQRNVDADRDRWVIQQACQRAEELALRAFVIPVCHKGNLDLLMTELVSRDMWRAACGVLMRGVSFTQHCWVLTEACCRAHSWQLERIVLPYCALEHCNSATNTLVSEEQWGSVCKLLNGSEDQRLTMKLNGINLDRYILDLVASRKGLDILKLLRICENDSKRVWSFCQDRMKTNQSYFQLYCRQHDSRLKRVRFNNTFTWTYGNKRFPEYITDLQNVFTVIIKASPKTNEQKNRVCIVPCCAGNNLDSIFTQCFDTFLKKNSSNESLQGFSDSQRTWVVGLLCGNSSNAQISEISVLSSTDEQLYSVLRQMLSLPAWWALGKVLEQGLDDSIVTQILKQTLLYDDEEMIVEHVLPHCTDSQTDLAVTQLVSAGQWKSVTKLVQFVGDRKQTWTVGETSVDTTLLHLVAGGRWREVGDMLQRGVDDAQFRWAADSAMLQADDIVFAEHILCLVVDSGTKDIDSVLAKMVSESKWSSVQKLLQLNEKQMWTVDELSVERNTLRLVAEGRWREVGIMFVQGVSDSQRWWLKQTASLFATSMDYIQYIIPYCADDQLDSVLTTLVERRLWKAVGEVLKRGVSDSVKRWAVMETCQHCLAGDGYRHSTRITVEYISPHCISCVDYSDDVDTYILDNILPHCADDQLDSVLTTLVERRRWKAVGEVLKRGVSDSVKRWSVMEAFQHCDTSNIIGFVKTYILDNILPHCTDDQLDSVLTTLVERGRWKAVGEVLKRNVSDSVNQLAVTEAFRYYVGNDSFAFQTEFIDNILPFCADNQMDYILKMVVESGRWQAVGKVLSKFGNAICQQCVVQKSCEHCKSIGVYFRDDHTTPADAFTSDILAFCADDELDLLHDTFITNDVCTAVRYESGREVSDSQRRVNIKTAFAHADEENLIEYILPYFVYDSIQSALKRLASRCFWKAFSVLLHYCIIDTLCMWTLVTLDIDSKEKVFLDMVRNPCDAVKRQIPSFWRLVNWSDLQCFLSERLHWDTPLCEVLCEVLLGAVKEIWLSGRWKDIPSDSTAAMNEASVMSKELHQLIIPILMKCNTSCVPYLLPKIQTMRHQLDNSRSTFSPLLPIYFAKCLIQEYYKRKAWLEMTNAILVVLTIDPVVPDVQSVALRVMLRHNRWDVISHACLSGVCEQDRRQLFQAAVKQRQWSAVKRWADHTLYDDQRLWALGEARQEKRWDVYIKLADHGLSEWERVGVLFRVAMHADWKLVHHMLRTVADVTNMIDLLTNTPGLLSKLGAKKYEKRMNDFKEFKKDLTKDTDTLKTLKTMVKLGKWWVVLHNIRHKPNLQHARCALKAAVSSEAWHAVMQLVRLETDVTRRDSLFRDMARLRQWAVCRELLEQGVSLDLSLELVPELIGHSQWTLVAIVMECSMDDVRRKNIMHQAILMREGSVVWECINKLQTGLSVDEREEAFQQTFNREVWQAVKPLIEEKDVTGIGHRNTALLEAIEQHQWDVVDHCQRHHADINMKDDDGHTPIHRAARKGDWEAVKELTVRDGDPNLLDSEGLSVLHRAIEAKQWDAVQLLIQFHGDIHQAPLYDCYSIFDYDERKTRTPLQMLIDARQGEVIETSLMWCPDQQKVVNYKKETVLHAVCLSGWPGALHHLVARKVDPLAVTDRGLTALSYAVLCKDCPQRMVAECIKLGFSTHQSHITHTARIDMTFLSDSLTEEEQRLLMSPLVLAVMRGLPVVTQMLCEAGACSSRQLCELNVHLVELTKPNTDKGRRFRREFSEAWEDVHNLGYSDPDYSFDTALIEQSADYLRQVSSTPRSLVSTCRLVISRCLTLSKTRHRDIAQLPLSPMMKDYLMFSDLTDPRYPDLSYRGKE